MNDDVFLSFLRGYAYAIQARGFGDAPVPSSFKPIVPYYKNTDGTIAREKTLEGSPFAGIIGFWRANLLKGA